jgi:muconolactone delta-isomerase
VAAEAADLQRAHEQLLEIGHLLEPTEGEGGAQVRERVEHALDDLTTSLGTLPGWLQPRCAYLVTVLRRLSDGLYQCYDVPGLPRTNNDLEQFYRKIKASERRITGHRRSDRFVVRVGGFAVYALVASDLKEGDLQHQLAQVPAQRWQAERVILRANQERQVKMRRFHLHRAAYLADLEARWTQLSQAP